MRQAAAIIACAVMVVGCAFELQPCTSDADCPSGTACARPAGTDVPMCLASDVPDGTEDVGTASNTAPGPDAANNTNNANNTNSPDPDVGPALQCAPVTDCGALEPNDTEDDAILLSGQSAVGCAGFRLEPWSTLHQDKVCAGDEDQFIIEYVACDEGSFRLTVSLTTPDMCPQGGMLDIVEGLYDCGDRNVRCEVVDDVERVIIIVRAQDFPQPIEKIRFAVQPAIADVGVEYILRATVGR